MRAFTTAAVSLLVVCAAYFVCFGADLTRSSCAELFCPGLPLCEQRSGRLVDRLACRFGFSPLKPDSREFQRYVVSRLRTLVEASMRGQVMAPAVVEMVAHKLRHPHEAMVLHFAGDNGVGKTRLAELISLAYGQRCGDALCTIGDTTVVLSGTGYDGMSTAEFREAVVRLVALHAARHPHDGVVIVNELSSLEPSKVRVLLPLLGRASAFPEHPGVAVSTQLVILTTDFGREGRTRGKSLSEMRRFIDDEFRELYTAQAASYMRTLPFLPISLETAGDIVRVVVRDMGCAEHPPLRLTISDTAVLWLVERTKATLSVENGRAVAQETRLHVGPLVERAAQTDALAESASAAHKDGSTPPSCGTVANCTVDVDGVGQLEISC